MTKFVILICNHIYKNELMDRCLKFKSSIRFTLASVVVPVAQCTTTHMLNIHRDCVIINGQIRTNYWAM